MTFSTADLSDLGADKAQFLNPGFRHFAGQRKFCGAVSTVHCFEDNSMVRKMLENKVFGRVLVVDGGASMNCALLGDMLATLAIENGWRGLIINGCVRDTTVLRKLRLGVMALGSHPRKSKKMNSGETDVSVSFAGATFLPNCYAYADSDGVLIFADKIVD